MSDITLKKEFFKSDSRQFLGLFATAGAVLALFAALYGKVSIFYTFLLGGVAFRELSASQVPAIAFKDDRIEMKQSSFSEKLVIPYDQIKSIEANDEKVVITLAEKALIFLPEFCDKEDYPTIVELFKSLNLKKEEYQTITELFKSRRSKIAAKTYP
ncbi:hypothetical protein EDC44_13120 [Cricetibacter osteomyelitidis]|uniref:Uncharacterized protein n=1 Tax=Cricetibacter osteomyelitidis TaxID=1521931 RepID=A0A4R2SSS4_9PAST|nr:hypothetical protein [Cricetibacter osteomyelitidis]TCP91314.1 hypothetical protein EDC44_13120 [Cricetibacter osteomyelitidis]